MNHLVSFQVVLATVNLPANVALVTLAQVVSVNVASQVAQARVRIGAEQAVVPYVF